MAAVIRRPRAERATTICPALVEAVNTLTLRRQVEAEFRCLGVVDDGWRSGRRRYGAA